VLAQNSSLQKTTLNLSYQELLEKVVGDSCRDLNLDESYVDKVLSCKFPTERITPLSIVSMYRETDRIVEVCDEARRRAVVMEWSGGKTNFVSELRKDLSARADLCRENLEQGLRSVSDPRAILGMFHYSPEIRATLTHMNLVLDIAPERIGGDFSRHDASEMNKFREGGWMYQASDLHSIKSVFSFLRMRSGVSFVDLGSGYGHPVFYGANLRPDIMFNGVEIMSSRVESCRAVAKRLQLSNAHFEVADAAKCDISSADVIFLFNPFPPSARSEVNRKLLDLAEAKPVVIIDHEGLVTRQDFSFRRMDRGQAYPFHIYGSREHYEGSLAIAGLPTVKA
jgi:hypothetical protein